MTHTSTAESHSTATLIPVLVDHKAKDIVMLDIGAITDLADLMIICSGHSNRHILALAEYVITAAKKSGMTILSVEGQKEAEWILIDLAEVIVHIMLPKAREFYALEKLWGKSAQAG